MPHNSFNTLKTFTPAAGKAGQFYSLPELAKTFPNVKRLPHSIRIVLESVLRNVDGKKVTEEHVKQLANWKATGARTEEIPFILAHPGKSRRELAAAAGRALGDAPDIERVGRLLVDLRLER